MGCWRYSCRHGKVSSFTYPLYWRRTERRMKRRYCTGTFFAFWAVLFIPCALAANLSKSPVSSTPESAAQQQYVIHRGDTLYGIAKTFHITQEALMAANNLESTKINIGQVLKVPADKGTQRPGKSLNPKASPEVSNKLSVSTEAPKKEGPQTYENYVTRRGDTLFQIAKTFNTTPNALKSANKLKSSRIKVGQTLKIPSSQSAASIDKAPDTPKTAKAAVTAPILSANLTQPKGAEQNNAENLPLRERLVEAGFQMLGVRYRFSGTSEKTGLDCSALVRNLFSKVNISLPRSSKEQYKTGEKIDRNNLEAGDLVFFSSGGKTPTHVGIYIGNNQFIHAARKAKQVIVSDLNKLWYSTRYLGARRIMDLWWEEPPSSADSGNK